MRLRYFIYLVLFMTLSCVKEQEELVVPDGAVTATIPYTVVVHGSQATRASIDGPFGTGEYIFQEGDRLFIVDTDTGGIDLYGVLTLIDGAGSGSGTFEGTLNCTVSPTDETELSATLVGPDAAAGFYSISGEKVTGPTYPSSIPYEAGGLAEYVKKYSHFTSSSTFGAKNFTLTQQTVFVNFNIEHIAKACLTNSSATEIGISIKSGEPLTTVRTFTDIPWAGGNDYIGNVSFTGIFKADDDVRSGQICVEDCTIPITSDDYNGNFDDDQTLSANRYYTVTRTFDPQWPGFRITATVNSTNVYFNYYAAADVIKYSLDDGMTWSSYTSRVAIPLNKDESVCFKGQRTDYKNIQGDQYETPNGTPVFDVDDNKKKCYISGNIMSLLDDDNDTSTLDDDDGVSTIAANAFSGAFSKGTTAIAYIDIHPTKPLILPATVLGDKCYKNMFRFCTNLTRIPALPATTVSVDCYRGMFRQCTNLQSVSLVLEAPNLADDCYREMFRGCTKLTSVNTGMLPAMNLAPRCYQQMFSDCKFTTGPALPATELQEGCYNEMFSRCTNLTTAPELPAETLVKQCYIIMFDGCTSLNYIKCLATNISASECTKNWVRSVQTTAGTFVKNANMSGWTTGVNGIPTNWTVEEYPPSE